MSESAPPGGSWSQTSAKTKTAVQKSVTELLDELAPERAVSSANRPAADIEQHRTPTGCILQAPNAALTVSWFPDESPESPLGELDVVLWRGTVARRGAPRKAKGAEMVETLVLRPVEPQEENCEWVGGDGQRYDARSLAKHCLALLDRQITSEAGPT